MGKKVTIDKNDLYALLNGASKFFPKKASVAFDAAAPLKDAIAVPVDADAKVVAAPYAPKAVKAPPIAPAAAPPATSIAKLPSSFNS